MTSSKIIKFIAPTFVFFFFLYFTFETFNNPLLNTSKRGITLHGNFLHITDFHPDPHYVINSTIKSRCHGGRQKRHQQISGTWGSSATSCDSPMGLVNATFNWLAKNWVDKLDFIIWTGDNSRHDNDDNIPRKAQEVFELNNMIASKFLETFSKKGLRGKKKPYFIPIVPSIGNNDIHPNNIISAGPNEVLSVLHTIWEPFIPKGQHETFLNGGYFYTEVIPKKLIVISLNTMYFYNTNTAVNGCKSPEEPGTIEMNWLKEVLKKARKRGMRVYITGHVAPRKKHYTRSCYKVYKKISIKFHDLILGHYYGHSNMDHFFFIGANTDLSKFPRISDGDDNDDNDYIEEDYTKEDYIDYTEDYKNSKEENYIEEDYTNHKDDNHTEEDYKNSKDDNYKELFRKRPSNKISKYLRKLYNHYRSVPPLTEGVGKQYAVVHINPSVIPVFYPALRIFKYNTTEVETEVKTKVVEDNIDEDDIDYNDEEDEEEEDNSPKPLKKNKRPKGEDPKAPSHINTFLTPLGYTQYFINLTHSNQFTTHEPEYTIEYTTWDDYNMKDLTVPSYVSLARRVTSRKLRNILWKKVEDHLMVGTRPLIESTKDVESQDSKGPKDYIISELDF